MFDRNVVSIKMLILRHKILAKIIVTISNKMCTKTDLIGYCTVEISHLIGQAVEESPGDVEEVNWTIYFSIHILYPNQLTESDYRPMTTQTITWKKEKKLYQIEERRWRSFKFFSFLYIVFYWVLTTIPHGLYIFTLSYYFLQWSTTQDISHSLWL